MKDSVIFTQDSASVFIIKIPLRFPRATQDSTDFTLAHFQLII